MLRCPFCKKKNQSESHKCKHCGKDLNTNEAKELMYKAKKQDVWLIISIVGVFAMIFNPYIGFLIFVTGIWLHPRNNEPFFKNRFKEYQNYKLRIILSILLFIFSVWLNHHQEQQRFIKNYPMPKIYVLSSQDNQGENKQYLLELSASDYLEVRVNNNLLNEENGKFKLKIDLNDPKTKLQIIAKNEHKTTKKEIVISRNETEKETAERLAMEEEEKIRKEKVEKARLAEIEKQKEIEKQTLMADLDFIETDIENYQIVYGGKYDSIVGILLAIDELKRWRDYISKARQSEFPEVQKLGEQIGRNISSLQVREFPKMRKAYGKIANTELWRHDVDVKVFGTANGTIELVGYHFTLNANIEDSHKEIREMLALLRFDKANYRWIEGGDGGVYTLESKKDSEI